MKLELIDKVSEAPNVRTFIFKPNRKMVWKSGQYIYFNLDEDIRQFTISSSTTEKVVQITTEINKNSNFKIKLDNLKIGHTIVAKGPFGSYVYNPRCKDQVYIAGGIGITPYRSMIKYQIDIGFKSNIYIIYSNSDDRFVFKKEFDKWQTKTKLLKVYYHDTSKKGRLNKTLIKKIVSTNNINSAYFWVSGSNEFVDNIEDILVKLDIEDDKIRTEKFTNL